MRQTTPREIIKVISDNASGSVPQNYFLDTVFDGEEFDFTTRKGKPGSTVKYDSGHPDRFLEPGGKIKKALQDGRQKLLNGLEKLYKEILSKPSEAAPIKQGLFALMNDCEIPPSLFLNGLDKDEHRCVIATYILYLHALDFDIFSVTFRDELQSIIKKKNPAASLGEDMSLILALRVLCSSYIPGSHRYVTLTRYSLYALICHFYPEVKCCEEAFGITAENALMRESEDTAKSTKESFCRTVFTQDEVTSLQRCLYFEVPVKKGAAGQSFPDNQAKVLNVGLNLPKLPTDQIDRSAEEVQKCLFQIYSNFPQSFHDNIDGKWKRELNITISDFLLSMAYRDRFRSELGRNELVDKASLLVQTHNQHQSYLYAFCEQRESAIGDERSVVPLYREFDPQEIKSRQAIGVIGKFYQDVFATTNTHTSFGKKLVAWVKSDRTVLKTLIDNNCYDPAIWATYRDANPSENEFTLRSIVTTRLLNKTFDLRNQTFLHHLMGFMQLVTKLNTRGSINNWLLSAPNEKVYEQKLMGLMRAVVMHMHKLPDVHRQTINQTLILYLQALPNSSEDELNKEAFIRSCERADWDNAGFSKRFLSDRNTVLTGEIPPQTAQITAAMAAEAVEACAVRLKGKNPASASEVIRAINNFLNFKTDDYNADALSQFDSCLSYLLRQEDLETSNPKVYGAILRCHHAWRGLQDETKQGLINFAERFLSCDYYKSAKAIAVITALKILAKDYQTDHQKTFEFYFRHYAEQNHSKNYDNLRILVSIVEIWLKSAQGREFLTQKLCADSLYANTIHTLCNPSKKHVFQGAQKHNDVLYRYVCGLLAPDKFWMLLLDAQTGLAHYAKKDDRLRAQFSNLLSHAVSDWQSIKEEKVRYALACHIGYFYEDAMPACVEAYVESLLEQAHADMWDVARRCGTKPETFLVHLMRLLGRHPEKTAIFCAKEQTKLLGQMRHEQNNPDVISYEDIERRSRRKRFLPQAIANPAIYQFSKSYCKQMIEIIKSNPASDYEEIRQLLNDAIKGNFPCWEVSVDEVWEYVPETMDIPVTSMDIAFYNGAPSAEKLREIGDKEGPWENRYNEETGVYTPRFNIVLFEQSDGVLEFIDGKGTFYWLQQRVLGSDECFDVRVSIFKLKK